MKRRDFICGTSAGAAILSLGGLSGWTYPKGQEYVRQSKRSLPLIFDVDVVVVGGSTAGVAAAAKAAQTGAKVLLLSAEPYLGEDLCATFQLWRPSGQPEFHPLEHTLFGDDGFATPMHIKKTLDEALLQNKVMFLYSSIVTDILVDGRQEITGVVMVNRSGRQAVKAKTVIDATPYGTVTHLTNATFRTRQEPTRFTWISVGNSNVDGAKRLPNELTIDKKNYPVWETEYFDSWKDDMTTWSQTEQAIRDKTWDAAQVESSERPAFVPHEHIAGIRTINQYITPDKIDIEAFMPRKVNNLYVLSGLAALTGDTAAQYLQPGAMIAVGDRIGEEAAVRAKKRTCFGSITVKGLRVGSDYAGDVREQLDGIRASLNLDTVSAGDTALPVLGIYDVVVVGGGTAGAPVGIGAARKGAKTLLLEYLHDLGGMMTAGLIGRYFWGYREGFSREVDAGVRAIGGDNSRQKKNDVEWNFDWKTEWFRREIRKAGGEIWYGVLGCGAFVDGNQVKGVVVATPFRRGVVLAHTVVDSTGSADIAVVAGAGYSYTDGSTVAVQGAGLPPRKPNDFYNNTDWTFIDDTDAIDVWRTFVQAKKKYADQFDLGKIPQTRERRRIVGDFTVQVLDVYNHRTYPDVISIHYSSFDTHGFTEHPFFSMKPPAHSGMGVKAYVPFRALLPQGLEGIIVTGLGASADRDAMPVIRMQPCLQNQGYAVGFAAAQANQNGQLIRHINLRPLQEELVQIGSLTPELLDAKDNFPPTDEQLRKASFDVVNNLDGLELLLWQPERAMPLLEERYRAATKEEDKLVYARILGFMKNPIGWETLKKAIDAFDKWDAGWNFRGMGQFGHSMSYLDSLIIALGYCKKEEALPSIIRLAEMLTPQNTFSHFRAIAVACESIGSDKAAPILYGLLQQPDMQGHAMTDIETALEMVVPDQTDTSTRNASLKEIFLARALLKVGDRNGLGRKIMEDYAADLRGHYYRHANGVLKEHLKFEIDKR
ncbi:MAG: FAD-dependent oxidoreductase [Bacteroidales bacterium]|jgi:flavin-dependent dehydrogenase|nr:FAD-dependent oxidoreductase [Bacteroidales bacterium]